MFYFVLVVVSILLRASGLHGQWYTGIGYLHVCMTDRVEVGRSGHSRGFAA